MIGETRPSTNGRGMLARAAAGRGRQARGLAGCVPLVRGLAGCVLAGALTLAGCADDGGPRLDAVMPVMAARGAMVTLTGSRLCGASGDCATAAGEVEIGLALPMVRAVVISYTDASAQIMIPPVTPVGATQLVVTVGERSSNAIDFMVLGEAPR